MHTTPTQLVDDTIVNVAQLLKENVGSKRHLSVTLTELPLDENIVARDIEADVKLTRISDGILVSGIMGGQARVECVRCLQEFDTEFRGELEAQYRPSVDILTGIPVEPEDDGETFEIDEGHQLDLAELLRQVALLILPIRPICGDDCPGFQREFRGGDAPPSEDEVGDERLAVLEQLLDDSQNAQ